MSLTNFKNYLLISTPGLNDSIFRKSIVLVCDHDENGAMGLIVGAQLFHELEYMTPIAVYALIQYVALMFYIGNININRLSKA